MDTEKHHRRSMRLATYDYARLNRYFFTAVTLGRRYLFGRIEDGRMNLNAAGRIVEATWLGLPRRFPTVECDAFVVMPNHVHGIVRIVREPERGAASSAPTLGEIIRAFKPIAAVKVNRLPGCSGQPLWQRNYYEHIIRDGESLDRIRQYILENPSRWQADRENPEAGSAAEPEHWLDTI